MVDGGRRVAADGSAVNEPDGSTSCRGSASDVAPASKGKAMESAVGGGVIKVADWLESKLSYGSPSGNRPLTGDCD